MPERVIVPPPDTAVEDTVLQTLRVPLGIGAFLFALAVLFLIARTIRSDVSGPTPASS